MSIPAFVTSTAAYLNDIGDFSNTNNKSNYITSLPTSDRLVWKNTADGTVTVTNNRFWDDTGATGIYSTTKTANVHTPELWKEFWTNYYPLSQEEYNKNPEKYDKMFGDFLTDYVTRYLLKEGTFTPNSDRPKTKLFQNAISTDPAVYMKQFKAYLDTCGTPANPGPYGYTSTISNTTEIKALDTAKTNTTKAITDEITYLTGLINTLNSWTATSNFNTIIADLSNMGVQRNDISNGSDYFLSPSLKADGTFYINLKPDDPNFAKKEITNISSKARFGSDNTLAFYERKIDANVTVNNTQYNYLNGIINGIINSESNFSKFLSYNFVYTYAFRDFAIIMSHGDNRQQADGGSTDDGWRALNSNVVNSDTYKYNGNTFEENVTYRSIIYDSDNGQGKVMRDPPYDFDGIYLAPFKTKFLDTQWPKAKAEITNIINSLNTKKTELEAKEKSIKAEYDVRIAELKAQEKTTQVLTPSLALKATNSIAYVTQLLRKMYTSLQQTASTQADIISNYASNIEKGVNTLKAYFKKKADALAATTAAPPQPKTGGGSVTEDEMKAYRKAMEQKGRYDTAYNSCETQLQIVGNTNKTYFSSLDATNNALTPASDLINSLITLRSSIMRALIGS